MRVMTFNIWNYNRPWKTRRAMIAELIAVHKPDVVALQETRHDWRFEGGLGQGEQLAQLTGYHPTSCVAQVYTPILRVDEGLTTLTRQAPVASAMRSLTLHPHDREDENHRVCLAVTVEDAGKAVHVFNTHFSLSPMARMTNAVEVAQFVAELAAGEPAVVLGDLNAEPATPPIQFLVGEGKIDGESAGFLDCWTAANPGDLGFTYASFDPVRRIDYALGCGLPALPDRAYVVGEDGVRGTYPSDHMGIVVEFTL